MRTAFGHLSQNLLSAIVYTGRHIKARWAEQYSFFDHWKNNVPSHIGTFLCSAMSWESNHPCMKQVTGASGFLGSHIVDQLLEKGYYVKAWAWVRCCSLICWLSLASDSAARGKKAEALRVLYASIPGCVSRRWCSHWHCHFLDGKRCCTYVVFEPRHSFETSILIFNW